MTAPDGHPGRLGTDQAPPTEALLFERHRPQLVRLGFRILRSVPDSEDAVQEAWLRWHRSQRCDLARPEAFLNTVVARLSLDRLRRVHTRREAPLEDERIGEDRASDPQVVVVELAESISEALLVLRQRLSPAERCAIMLRDVFGLPYAEVGHHLGRGDAAARQLVSRGRRRLHDPTIRYVADDIGHARAVHAFRAACRGGDLGPLLEALAGGPGRLRDPGTGVGARTGRLC